MMASSPAPVSSPPGGGFFFGDSGTKKKTDEPKPIENPFLSRNMTRFSPSHQPMTLHTRQSSPSVSGPSLAQNSGLRQRKPLRQPSPKPAGLLFHLPPRPVSVSLGATVDTMTKGTPSRSPPSALMTTPNAATTTTTTTTTAAPSPSIGNALIPVQQQPSPQRASGSWVLVYGYTNQSQFEVLVKRFSSFGRVLQRQGSCQPGRSNWIAFQYESSLEAEKALCHQNTQVVDGIFCGVKRLADNDPILTQATAQGPSLSSLWIQTDDDDGKKNAVATKTMQALDENDILLSPSHPTLRGRRKRSVCEEFARWVFAITDSA